MSRILDALKKAVPLAREASSEPAKPLIFEKVSFDAPSPENVRREVEARKESARLRYLLNEQAARPVFSEEKRQFVWVLTALVAAGLAAVLLWPRDSQAPKAEASETARWEERVAQLEAELDAKNLEIERLRKDSRVEASAGDSEVESLRAEVRKLNRRLTVMLQDNLEKDQEIARLQNS
jgi:hypothetical protein